MRRNEREEEVDSEVLFLRKCVLSGWAPRNTSKPITLNWKSSQAPMLYLVCLSASQWFCINVEREINADIIFPLLIMTTCRRKKLWAHKATNKSMFDYEKTHKELSFDIMKSCVSLHSTFHVKPHISRDVEKKRIWFLGSHCPVPVQFWNASIINFNCARTIEINNSPQLAFRNSSSRLWLMFATCEVDDKEEKISDRRKTSADAWNLLF